MLRFADGFETPMLWSARQGLLEIAPGWVGFVNAVSPDGSTAGGGNYDQASAFLWDDKDGAAGLVELIERLDAQYGTHLMDFFAGAGRPVHDHRHFGRQQAHRRHRRPR